MRRSLLTIAVLVPLACGCFITSGPDRYGHWWRKEPVPEEAAFFEKARHGAVSPEDRPSEDGFVGWFGILLDIERGESEVNLDLDHRYADDLNVYYGVADTSAITTVSLFGGGRFYARMYGQTGADDWLPGDLVRVYGVMIDSAGERPVVEVAFMRHWTRRTYELSPLRAVRRNGNMARRDGWPELIWDESVPSARTPIDEELRERLLAMFRAGSSEQRLRVAFTLAELGGPGVVEALTAAMAHEKDAKLIASYGRYIDRAECKIGPIWCPDLPCPYWKAFSPNARAS